LKLIIIFISILLFTTVSLAQAIFTDEDVKICNSKFEFAASKNLIEKPINEIMVEVGKTFLGLD